MTATSWRRERTSIVSDLAGSDPWMVVRIVQPPAEAKAATRPWQCSCIAAAVRSSAPRSAISIVNPTALATAAQVAIATWAPLPSSIRLRLDCDVPANLATSACDLPAASLARRTRAPASAQ